MNALENTGRYGTRVYDAWSGIYLVVYDDGYNVPYAYFVLRTNGHDVARDPDGRVVIQFYDDAQNAGYPGTYTPPNLNDPVGTAGIPPVVDATMVLRREELPLSTVLQHSITLYDADDAPVPPEPPARPKKGQPKPDVKGKRGRCGGYCTLCTWCKDHCEACRTPRPREWQRAGLASVA